MVWYDMVWHDMVMVWYIGTVWYIGILVYIVYWYGIAYGMVWRRVA